jgi:ribosomal-protein-serine acetyltransferase
MKAAAGPPSDVPGFVELSDDRVRVRPYRPDDVPRLFAAAQESIADIYPWLEWCHPNYALDDSAAWISSREQAWKEGTDYSFVVTDALDGTFLGGVGINQITWLHRVANLGYWVRSTATGRGVAARATRLVARFGFLVLGLERIEIVASVHNRRSQRVAQKAGATREAVLRRRLLLHGIAHDAVMFSFVATDVR